MFNINFFSKKSLKRHPIALKIKNKSLKEILFSFQLQCKCLRKKTWYGVTHILCRTLRLLKCIHIIQSEMSFHFFRAVTCTAPGYTYNRYFGCLRYVVIPSPINAEAASQFCANEGGQLLLLNSDEEVEELRRLIGMSSALGWKLFDKWNSDDS